MKMMRRALLLLLVLLSGCASSQKGGAATPLTPDKFEQSAVFKVRWHRNIGVLGNAVDYSIAPLGNPADVRWRMLPDFGDMGNSSLQPALTADAIYASNAEGILVRLDRRNGKQNWRVACGFPVSGGVGVGSGLVLVGGEKGEVAAYGEDGKLRWKTLVSSEVLSVPQVAGGLVVVRSGDGRIAGLDASDGKRKWLYERITPALAVRSSADVTILNDTIYAGFAGGKLAAIDMSNGTVKWESKLSEPRGTTELERISDITSKVWVDSSSVCAVSFQGRVGCFDVAQGTPQWSRELSSDKGMLVQDGTLYVSTATGEVLAMDKTNGSSQWKNDLLAARRTSAAAALGDYVVVGDGRGMLFALKRSDGSLAARLETDGSAIVSAPIALDGGLLVSTHNGGLYSVELH